MSNSHRDMPILLWLMGGSQFTIRVQPMWLCSLIISYQQYGEPPGQTSVPQRTPQRWRVRHTFITLVPPPAALPKRAAGGSNRARMPPAGAAFGKAVSVDPVRVHNETPSHGLRTRLWGCPGVESSRDPWYTPAQVLPDLTCTVPNLIRGASRKCDEDKIANQYDWGNYRVYTRKQAKRAQ